MKIAVISSQDLHQANTLDADFWVNRKAGETYPNFRKRRKAEDLERRAQEHERQARKLRLEAENL